MTATVEQLLMRDLVDREVNMQDQATSYRTLCNLWVKGKCRGGRASACRDRHFCYIYPRPFQRIYDFSGRINPPEAAGRRGFIMPEKS